MATPANWTDFSNLDAERAIALGNRYLPGVVTLVLVLLLGWQLARLVWLLVPASPLGDTVTAAPPPGSAASAAVAGRQSVDVEAIASAHLFGEANAEDVANLPLPSPTEELEETRLALTLKGTMAGTDDRLTVAIIADNRNEEKVYSIGDAVVPGATLHAVYRDQVVLNRSGVLESLKLPKDMPTSSAPVQRATTTRTAIATPSEEPSIQETLTQNASRLTEVIRPVPYFVAGQQQGFRVYPGRDRKAFAALGLRPGDLVKDINGAALTDPQQAAQIFQDLGSADQVSVTVERNGQPEVLTLTTSQLELANEDE